MSGVLQKLLFLRDCKLSTSLDKEESDGLFKQLQSREEFISVLENSGLNIDCVLATLTSFPVLYIRHILILWEIFETTIRSNQPNKFPHPEDRGPKNNGNWNGSAIRKIKSSKPRRRSVKK
ncbi:hypothetical protein PPL_09045 [Heterostelium album PN500]|uniref:Uncharacterized protein n=1 Tax=Heterostelium pallidum (strain ATCC 26659 / Pp 5 / PN500) TaxID=670386 RepID=D3BKG4_HETP5|nr:hypothetical protein PPL_09045 [Heterostelium album PN500]EFA78394.1 hypothetical protein PPL_09045 [Heterostelium album PN500]|eukprot:XP_020430519.1 hypothetical protein PPL_09045 [Heterostelium album PN500]